MNGNQSISCTFKGDDLGGRIHDGALGGDGAADGVVGVRHVDDDHLRGLAHLLPDADELVALHGEGGKRDVRHVDAHIGKLEVKNAFSPTDWLEVAGTLGGGRAIERI